MAGVKAGVDALSKVAQELAERLQGGDSLAMDFASRMQGKSSAIGAGTLATGGLMASDDSEAAALPLEGLGYLGRVGDGVISKLLKGNL